MKNDFRSRIRIEIDYSFCIKNDLNLPKKHDCNGLPQGCSCTMNDFGRSLSVSVVFVERKWYFSLPKRPLERYVARDPNIPRFLRP